MPNPSTVSHVQLGGVRTNNLKGIDACFPLDKITVVTGVSGSGKSSLVFDSLYGEAWHRYVDSLSSFARQYLQSLPRPSLDRVENLPPAVAIRQSRGRDSGRSTVGSMTELTDVFRILFSLMGEIVCHDCGRTVRQESGDSVADALVTRLSGTRVLITAPLAPYKKLKASQLKFWLENQGFTRALVADEVVRIAGTSATALRSGAVVIDRVVVNRDSRDRLAEACRLAMKAGSGTVQIVPEEGESLEFSSRLHCCDVDYRLPSPALFNHNHPSGACGHCQGFGSIQVIDPEKVLPDPEGSLESRGVAPWNFGKAHLWYQAAIRSGKSRGIRPSTPFSKYSREDLDWLYGGSGREFTGVDGFFRWLDRKKYRAHYRIHGARFRSRRTCPVCKGARLNQQALAVQLDGQGLADIGATTIKELHQWLKGPQFSGKTAGIGKAEEAEEAIEEGLARLGYLEKVGLGYLTPGRPTRTLSGGEAQRINMARSLGSALTSTMFCLDEPTSGLHPSDSERLLAVIREIRARGNTVVVVEHERAIIRGADHLIEVGPGAGHEGGQIVFAGPPRPEETGLWQTPPPLPDGFNDFIKLRKATTHNLQGVEARFPVGRLTAVCGVSGSGKTSLVRHTLYPELARVLGIQAVDRTEGIESRGQAGPPGLIRRHKDVVIVGQEGIGRSTRSNIATYLDLYSPIRKLLAETPLAKARGYKPGHFSFNVAGGRCETCRGLGTVTEDLSFLGELEVNCPACKGKRFSEEVLEVRYRDKTLLDILQLTITECREFFFDRPALVPALDAAIHMGLGYVTLGQNTSSFSGGEAQRLKLLSLLKDTAGKERRILIFDEPTTGLSDKDVGVLIRQLRELTAAGHTVIVVEHHTGVLASADWLVEMGPGAAREGGRLVFEGPVEKIRACTGSMTAPYLGQHSG